MTSKGFQTLGELIDELKSIIQDNPLALDYVVMVDEREGLFPARYGSKRLTRKGIFPIRPTVVSYRGDYSEAALEPCYIGMGAASGPQSPLLKNVVAHLENKVGGVMVGWKGGEYPIKRNTPLWYTPDQRYCDNIFIRYIDILDEKLSIILRLDVMTDE